MEQMSELAGKAVGGGVLTALGAVAGAVLNAWVARRKDSGDQSVKHEETAMNAIIAGNRQLMDSLLQTAKQLSEELRQTRTELAECEAKHRESDARIAELERLVKPRRNSTTQ